MRGSMDGCARRKLACERSWLQALKGGAKASKPASGKKEKKASGSAKKKQSKKKV